MVGVACLYGGGVLIAELFAFPVLPLWSATIALLLVAIFIRKVGVYSLGAALVFAGALGLTLSKAVLGPKDLRKLLPSKPELVSVRGKLPQTPLGREYDDGTKKSW